MDFKWLALLSFVVHLWPKLNVIYLYSQLQAPVPHAISGLVQFSGSSTGNQFPNTGNQGGRTYNPYFIILLFYLFYYFIIHKITLGT